MRITAEEVAVVAEGTSRQVLIVLDGYRIVLTRDEARTVADRLLAAVAALDRQIAASAAPAAKAATEGDAVLESLRRLNAAMSTTPAD